jgi:IMP dehydrogenase/GMP reductase
MDIHEMLFDFDDLVIEPATISPIKSRKNVNPKYSNGTYPLMTAPMDTVVSNKNYQLFSDLGIVVILPRVTSPGDYHISTDRFLSYSMDDFESIFLKNTITVPNGKRIYVLIDVANGHMEVLYYLAKKAKNIYGYSMCLMIGNVANPKTFTEYCKIGVDYVRIGIGNGNGCLTTVQTGVGYPMASLIEECYNIKKYNKHIETNIVADGGFKKYSDIIKALAIGADYVMLGSIFNKSLESSGETTRLNGEIIDQYDPRTLELFNAEIPLSKVFRGMSTKDVQKSLGKDDLVTSEGIIKTNLVEYTLEGWTRNFDSYLRSAMSYTGKEKLRDFIGGVQLNFITQNSFKRFDK